MKACSYQSVKSILRTGLDRQLTLDDASAQRAPIHHDNIRGTDYFNNEEEFLC